MSLLSKIIYLAAKKIRTLGYNFNEDLDERVIAMKKKIKHIGGKIEFKIDQYPDGSWTAESTNLDGIITGGTNTKELSAMIKDAIFTYFEIPPHLCNDALIRTNNEPVTVTQQAYV